MTFQELIDEINKLTPEQRQEDVCFDNCPLQSYNKLKLEQLRVGTGEFAKDFPILRLEDLEVYSRYAQKRFA